MRVGFACLALFFALCGVARVGTYEVVACGPDGVNRSWEPHVEAFPPNEPQPEAFDFHLDCAVGLGVSTHSPEQHSANYTSAGWLRFKAAPGTAIVAVRARRYGEVRSSGDDPNTP